MKELKTDSAWRPYYCLYRFKGLLVSCAAQHCDQVRSRIVSHPYHIIVCLKAFIIRLKLIIQVKNDDEDAAQTLKLILKSDSDWQLESATQNASGFGGSLNQV